MKIKQREVDMLQRIADGESLKKIASDMGIAYQTARNEKSRTIHKLGSDSILKAIVRAFSLGLIK